MTVASPNLTAPARIERALTLAILRGTYPPGSHLPPVRALAQKHGVNPSTMQRVLARLEMTGLVDVRQGSGIRVLDPEACGDLSLLPMWLEALSDQPARASAMLADLLEVRRVVAARLLTRHRTVLVQGAAGLVRAAERFRDLASAPVDALRDADLMFARVLLRQTGNTAAIAIFNSVERLVRETPWVAEAMYADPAANLAAMERVLQILGSTRDDAVVAREVARTLEEVDASTVAGFEALLRARRSEIAVERSA